MHFKPFITRLVSARMTPTSFFHESVTLNAPQCVDCQETKKHEETKSISEKGLIILCVLSVYVHFSVIKLEGLNGPV